MNPRTSLKRKLTLALALVALLSLCAPLVTQWLMASLSATVARLAHENLSTAAASARFAQLGQAIRLETPNLSNASTQFEREQALNLLQQHLRDLRQLLAETAAQGLHFQGVADILLGLDNIRDELVTNVSRRFVLNSELQRQVDRINRLHGDFLFEIEPLLAEAKFNVRQALQQPTLTAPTSALAAEIEFAEALSQLHAQANLSIGLMLRGANEPELASLEQLQLQVADSLAEAADNAHLLANNASTITLRQLWQEIARYGTGPTPLLGLKLQELALLREKARLQHSHDALLDQLADSVSDAVSASGQRSSQVASQIEQRVRQGQTFSLLSTLLILALLLSLLVLVVRGPLLRLLRILTAMREIASGEMKTRIQVQGQDEIGQLADAVRLFRRRSLALEQRAAELDRSNQHLNAEIERRHAAEADLRETQAELVQAAKMAALGQLSASIAHEFNQPLAAMHSYTHNALRYLQRGDNDKCQEKLEDIERLIKRLSTTSNHLKTFARRPQDALSPQSLNQLAENALSLFQERLRQQQVRVRWQCPSEPIQVVTEPSQLEQVIVNLISNALDAMQGCEAPELLIQLKQSERLASLHLSDNGMGLSESARQKLFEPFFTTKPPGQGLGLGLSISYNIIRDLGGRLLITPRPEGGVCASVELFKT
ncbi:ATP-binding protein [Balneatrix alpica]|uniref:histidine kinase n=1 Tax=Balneatrix alpica TaxID=75684 RepID=A0ABV5ZC66_9GAMM|nr:ATP-binding protein [Balneatrix alpica]